MKYSPAVDGPLVLRSTAPKTVCIFNVLHSTYPPYASDDNYTGSDAHLSKVGTSPHSTIVSGFRESAFSIAGHLIKTGAGHNIPRRYLRMHNIPRLYTNLRKNVQVWLQQLRHQAISQSRNVCPLGTRTRTHGTELTEQNSRNGTHRTHGNITHRSRNVCPLGTRTRTHGTEHSEQNSRNAGDATRPISPGAPKPNTTSNTTSNHSRLTPRRTRLDGRGGQCGHAWSAQAPVRTELSVGCIVLLWRSSCEVGSTVQRRYNVQPESCDVMRVTHSSGAACGQPETTRLVCSQDGSARIPTTANCCRKCPKHYFCIVIVVLRLWLHRTNSIHSRTYVLVGKEKYHRRKAS